MLNKLKRVIDKVKNKLLSLNNTISKSVNNTNYHEYVIDCSFWGTIIYIVVMSILNGYDSKIVINAKVMFADIVILLSLLPLIYRKDK